MGSQKKYGTIREVIQKIESYCAYQERAHFEVESKLYSWGLNLDEVDHVVIHLISANFLNESRFSEAFVSGKFRFKKWGRNKIIQKLKEKRVSAHCITLGLKEIDQGEYYDTIEQLIQKKIQTTAGTPYEVKGKVLRYMVTKGYEYSLVLETMDGLEI